MLCFNNNNNNNTFVERHSAVAYPSPETLCSSKVLSYYWFIAGAVFYHTKVEMVVYVFNVIFLLSCFLQSILTVMWNLLTSRVIQLN